MRKLLPILLSLIIAIGIVSLNETIEYNTYANLDLNVVQEDSIIPQAVLSLNPNYQHVQKVYQKEQLIGVLSDDADTEAFLNRIYLEKYQTDFPNTKLGFGEDIFISEVETNFNYENQDEAIFNYLANQDLFSVEADKVDFSNGAFIYVKSIDLFEQAKDLYLENFISRDAISLIRVNKLPPALTTYGMREIGFNIVEKAIYQRGLAPATEILKSVSEIVYFLSYGYSTEIELYTVLEYDTVEGIAYKSGLAPQQVVTINSDSVKSINQILEVGSQLNVTYFNSPINVVVNKERLAKETVYPQSTFYIKDNTMQEGFSVVQTKEELGYKDVMYKETFVNGVITDSVLISSTIIKQPVREVVRIGTKVVPGIGSGSFRWPLGADSKVSCRWYCYAGHQGLDLVYNFNKNGPIYAADRGVVSRVGYDWRNGYHVYIDHNNGTKTLYAHMVRYPPVKLGERIEKGDFIGNVGNTGRSTGAHLHFGIYVDGVAKNPCSYLDGC
jgi:murein DD-endopeptidase MepM/ murein hydrolase activator NlpD